MINNNENESMTNSSQYSSDRKTLINCFSRVQVKNLVHSLSLLVENNDGV